jgi:tetratricopeptide (TPR) repeat protein
MLHPEQPVAGFYLGLALLQLERPEEAAAAFRKVPGKSRLVGESKACLGVALYYSGKHKEAVELLEKDADDEVSYYFLGLSHIALGERGKAVKEFTQALIRDPSLATDRLARLKELFQKSSRRSG